MIANNMFRKIDELPVGEPVVLAASVSYSGSESGILRQNGPRNQVIRTTQRTDIGAD